MTGGPAGDSAVHLFGQVCNATTHTRIHIPRYATPCDLQAVLRQHADALRQAAMSILKSETLTGQELRDIIAQYPPQDPPRGQNGSGPDGGSPDSTPDDISGAPEMDTLSTPVLAGPVRRSEL